MAKESAKPANHRKSVSCDSKGKALSSSGGEVVSQNFDLVYWAASQTRTVDFVLSDVRKEVAQRADAERLLFEIKI